MSALLTTMKEKLLLLLAPLTQAGGGPLKEIEYVSFSAEADVSELLERFKTRAPAGYLSTPAFTLEKGQAGGGGIRTPNMVLNYLFAAAFAERHTPAERIADAEALADAFIEALALQRPTRTGLPTTAPVDFIGITDGGIFDDAEMTVFFARFQVAVRNVQLNSPA